MYNVTKEFYSFLNLLLKKGILKSIKQQFSNIDNNNNNNNNKYILKHKISISERSHDTEDWSNDAEHSALRHSNILHFKILNILKQKRVILNWNNNVLKNKLFCVLQKKVISLWKWRLPIGKKNTHVKY